ncbi:ester cyclase [Trichocoleus sp. FACHB-262]|uniref:ester cyclase n=1 Tax=Trichocoleus sp. FACHB-262 TaxID=2692869 RepID=UPI0016839F67|nr:ester cyclase [Trichocoleus sp. FACHB-262]MBD2123379.1 ester cyclase [Trichocoleus sp. FACHB-262]
MSTLETNKQVVSQYVAAFNQGDLETLQELFTPNALIQGVLGSANVDKAMLVWQELHEAFNIQLTVEEMIAEGDTVAVRYIERGTFIGSFRGQSPTGKSYELVAIEWFTFQNGKIHYRWGARDSASQARQVGLSLA